MSVIHQTIFIKEMEQQAEDHTDQSRKGHPFQGNAAQLNGYAGQTNDQNNRGKYGISGSVIVYFGIHQNTQTGGADHTIQQEGDAADDSAGDGVDQGSQLADEGTAQGHNCRAADDVDAVNLCHSHNTDVFAVSCGRHGTDAGGEEAGEVIRKEGTMQTGVFDQVSADDLTCYDLMADMFGNDNQQGRQHDGDCLRVELGRGEIGQSQPACFRYCGEIYNAQKVCGHITADHGDQDGDHRQELTEQHRA